MITLVDSNVTVNEPVELPLSGAKDGRSQAKKGLTSTCRLRYGKEILKRSNGHGKPKLGQECVSELLTHSMPRQ